ncbi:hypothetical protein [Rhizobium sp. SSA_523]|uniref:DUF6894 family protein n=1 Tax=Rhizobium sp. SSA_523 TaxID=2952477 RepID=UPI0020919065|nr:hypothetical protein [Rhizobium sp. SSA_523]MCO5732852.1 hypothetical protein [Rhizobium sp. SSA_523]WKC23531.1 hypothetical protein QTJ18_22490 [Rhizobium sp. SSA_523]
MPRYFFHLCDEGALDQDEEGTDLPNDDIAFQEAVLAAREMVSEEVRGGNVIHDRVFVVVSWDGRTVFSFPFRSVIRFD